MALGWSDCSEIWRLSRPAWVPRRLWNFRSVRIISWLRDFTGPFRRLSLLNRGPAVYQYLTHWGRQNGRHFAGDILKCIFLNENEWISLKISLKFVSKVRINNTAALVKIMTWRRLGDKPLSEPMMIRLPTHIWRLNEFITDVTGTKGRCWTYSWLKVGDSWDTLKGIVCPSLWMSS